MKLEVGKFYRTRDGRKVIILRNVGLWEGFLFGGSHYYFLENGYCRENSSLSLIMEWEGEFDDKQEPNALLKSHVHIRENDIGITVRLRNGAVRLITGVLEPFGDNEFNFTIGADTYNRRDGRYSIHNETPKDIIEILGFPGEKK